MSGKNSRPLPTKKNTFPCLNWLDLAKFQLALSNSHSHNNNNTFYSTFFIKSYFCTMRRTLIFTYRWHIAALLHTKRHQSQARQHNPSFVPIQPLPTEVRLFCMLLFQNKAPIWISGSLPNVYSNKTSTSRHLRQTLLRSTFMLKQMSCTSSFEL